MNKLGMNIKKLRSKRGLTQQALADMVDATTYTTISKWESGANSPRGGDLVLLSEIFNVSVDSLLGLNEELEEKRYYTYLPTAISAGLPLTVDGVTQADKISIPDSIMGKWSGHQDIMILAINGDSMDKIMPDGSLIALKTVPIESLNNGDIVVFSDDHEYSVKRYFKRNDRLVFRPESTSNEHYDQIYSMDDSITIHGKVVLYIVELD